MQSVSSRIWTRVAVSISYDDKHYTTGTSYVDHASAVKKKRNHQKFVGGFALSK